MATPPISPPDWAVFLVLSYMMICIVFAIIANVILCKYRNELFMQKRKQSIVFGLNISIIIGILSAFCGICAQYQKDGEMRIFFVGLYFASWFLIFLFLNVKNFFIHFRYKWQFYILQSKWQKIINPNVVQELQKHNFYVHNYHKYGKLRNVYIIFGIILGINFSICIFFMELRLSTIQTEKIRLISGGINMINFIFPFIIYIVIVCKTPIFEDAFFIHWESKMDVIFTFILFIQYLIANITLTVEGRVMLKESLIFHSVRVTALISLIFISTLMVIYKNRYNNDQQIEYNNVNDQRVTLDNILSNPDALNLFMHHLSTEYSTECLLSYIEFNQFQNSVLNDMKDQSASALSPNSDEIELNQIERAEGMKTLKLKNIPKSAILSEESSLLDMSQPQMNNIKKRAHLLYNKYIKIGSEFEINIDGLMRDNLHNILGEKDGLMSDNNISLHELVEIFEHPKQEMIMLLQYSFERMQQTKEYMQMIQILKNSSSQNRCKIFVIE